MLRSVRVRPTQAVSCLLQVVTGMVKVIMVVSISAAVILVVLKEGVRRSAGSLFVLNREFEIAQVRPQERLHVLGAML